MTRRVSSLLVVLRSKTQARLLAALLLQPTREGAASPGRGVRQATVAAAGGDVVHRAGSPSSLPAPVVTPAFRPGRPELLEWLGREPNPDASDVAASDELLELYERHTRHRARG